MAKAGRSVAQQLRTALGKLAKTSDDDKKADDTVSELDLSLLSGLTAVHPWIEDVASDRAQNELVSLGISDTTDFFDHANTRAAAYAQDRSAELVTQIDESTRKMVRQKIAAGLASGAMREDIIDSLSDIFDEDRAALIADTEVANANGQGALAGYKEAKAAGVKLRKIWVTDADPCEDCQENADAGAIDIEDEFPSGDDAEVAHPGCRCHTESVVEDDDEDLDDDE